MHADASTQGHWMVCWDRKWIMCYGFRSREDTTRLNIYGRTTLNLEVSRQHDESEGLQNDSREEGQNAKIVKLFCHKNLHLVYPDVPTTILLCHAARMAPRTETWLVSPSVQTDIQHLSNCWDSVQCWLATVSMLQQYQEQVYWHADVSIQLEAPVCPRAVNSSCWGLKGPTPS